jgi:hypothetical protein
MKRTVRLMGLALAVAMGWLAPGKIEGAESPSPQTAGQAPVEFIYGGITPDKSNFAYKIKVNTAKPIKEVHLHLKETDASGKVLFDGDLIWQNIRQGTQYPIEQGKTYDATMMMRSGVVKIECSLREVYFTDSTQNKAQEATPPSSAPTVASVAPAVTPQPTPVTTSPPPAASDAAVISQGEADSFARSVYRDMGKNDVAKVLAYFDTTVDYYSFGPKDKAFIAEQLKKYFDSFPIRLFSVGEVKLKAPTSAGKTPVTLEVRYTLRNGSGGPASTGRSEVEWDVVKRDGALRIVRFTGTSYPNPAQ